MTQDEPNFFAPRRCFLEPIPELFEAARLLGEAADAHVAGDAAKAKALIIEADMAPIFRWSETLFWGKTMPLEAVRNAIRWREDPNRPSAVPEDERASKNIPTDVKREVLARDGHFCRYCGVPVIYQPAQSALRKAYPETLRWGGGNLDKHTAFQALDLDFDHLLPRSLGGRNSVENLVVSCAPCNCGRANYTLAEVGLVDPSGREPEVAAGFAGWDGLTRVLRV